MIRSVVVVFEVAMNDGGCLAAAFSLSSSSNLGLSVNLADVAEAGQLQLSDDFVRNDIVQSKQQYNE